MALRVKLLGRHTVSEKLVLAFRKDFHTTMPHHVNAGDAQIAPGIKVLTLAAERNDHVALIYFGEFIEITGLKATATRRGIFAR